MYRPNLNGTWKGLMVSDWTDENGQTVPPKTMYVVVRQKFLSINFTTHTETFIGNSYVETFLIDKERGTLKVVYVYMKDSTDHNLQPENQGVSELRVIDSTPRKMEGIFFTIIKSKGRINLGSMINDFISLTKQSPLNRMTPFDEYLKFYLASKKMTWLKSSVEFNRLVRQLYP